ncbi:hypothetical protein RR48_06142 [Papilio machaon]|uniref:Uncharacterized protein n=1 Tax=Papilio machaon TaxID=76193 RepID=A0A194RR96_PAPMA|nr:hypothetical protein RR48_06142 [Papilio machaon]
MGFLNAIPDFKEDSSWCLPPASCPDPHGERRINNRRMGTVSPRGQNVCSCLNEIQHKMVDNSTNICFGTRKEEFKQHDFLQLNQASRKRNAVVGAYKLNLIYKTLNERALNKVNREYKERKQTSCFALGCVE